MTGLVTVILLAVGAGLLLALALSLRAGKRSRAARPAARPSTGAQPIAPGARPAVPALRATVTSREPEGRMPFAEPGMRGRLFQYGGDGAGFEIDAPYAVIDVETTGFSPRNGDRVVEIAIARVDRSGRIEDEYSTLLNPGRDVGPIFVHGISNSEVRDAPRFQDVAGEILDRMDGAVVVAHNAVFEERFLAAEFKRGGITLPLNPALCSLWLARRTMNTPNHKLTTLARAAGLSTIAAHAALSDVRSVAALLPQMLRAHGEPLRYLSGLRPLPQLACEARPKTRAVELRRGTDGWMASLMSRLPMSVADASDVEGQRYLDSLADALADGRIVGGEAKALALLAGAAGMGAAQVEGLHRRYLDFMRQAALADAILTTAELRKLKTTAAALGLPAYFDDLKPTSPQDLVAARGIPSVPVPTMSPTPRQAPARPSIPVPPLPAARQAPASRAAGVRPSMPVPPLPPRPASRDVPARSPVQRCVHCRRAGHVRSTCPELAVAGS
ncbi:MAG TPA: exonuclease domain-containing protein [Blastococcus sp.]|nr:exonuclease domain-containing protein [Blastococcus sp.]